MSNARGKGSFSGLYFSELFYPFLFAINSCDSPESVEIVRRCKNSESKILKPLKQYLKHVSPLEMLHYDTPDLLLLLKMNSFSVSSFLSTG